MTPEQVFECIEASKMRFAIFMQGDRSKLDELIIMDLRDPTRVKAIKEAGEAIQDLFLGQLTSSEIRTLGKTAFVSRTEAALRIRRENLPEGFKPLRDEYLQEISSIKKRLQRADRDARYWRNKEIRKLTE